MEPRLYLRICSCFHFAQWIGRRRDLLTKRRQPITYTD